VAPSKTTCCCHSIVLSAVAAAAHGSATQQFMINWVWLPHSAHSGQVMCSSWCGIPGLGGSHSWRSRHCSSSPVRCEHMYTQHSSGGVAARSRAVGMPCAMLRPHPSPSPPFPGSPPPLRLTTVPPAPLVSPHTSAAMPAQQVLGCKQCGGQPQRQAGPLRHHTSGRQQVCEQHVWHPPDDGALTGNQQSA
jgi:hypothetical protein